MMKGAIGFALSGLLLYLVLCTVCIANEFYGGNEYICTTEYNENYIYKWSASSGSNKENDENTFAWTAPEVNSPTEVAISLLVVDKTCGCHKNFDATITVLPREEIKLQILSNDTENSTPINPADNNTFLDPGSDSPENITEPANLTPDALSPSSKLEDNGTADSVNDAGTTDNAPLLESNGTLMESETQPAPEQAEDADSNNAIWSIPLKFGDGTEVDVLVVESSPGKFAASVDSDDGNFQLAPDADISENSTAMQNDGAPPTPHDINQTHDQSNQTGETETLPAAIEENNTAVDLHVQSGEDKSPPPSEEEPGGSELADNQLDADPVSLEQLASEATPSNASSGTPAKSELPSA